MFYSITCISQKNNTCFMWHITCKNHIILDFKETIKYFKTTTDEIFLFYSAVEF